MASQVLVDRRIVTLESTHATCGVVAVLAHLATVLSLITVEFDIFDILHITRTRARNPTCRTLLTSAPSAN